MRLVVLIAGLIGFCASAASADLIRHECTFPQERARGGGWIPAVVVINEDTAKSTVMVFDPIIQDFIGQPIAAARGEETRARISFSWKYKTSNKGQTPIRNFRLTYFKDGRPAKMDVQAGGADNKWTGEGACKVTTRG